MEGFHSMRLEQTREQHRREGKRPCGDVSRDTDGQRELVDSPQACYLSAEGVRLARIWLGGCESHFPHERTNAGPHGKELPDDNRRDFGVLRYDLRGGECHEDCGKDIPDQYAKGVGGQNAFINGQRERRQRGG